MGSLRHEAVERSSPLRRDAVWFPGEYIDCANLANGGSDCRSLPPFAGGCQLVNWVDLILLAVLGIFGLRGFFRGLFREILSLAGLIVGFLVAARYGEVLARYAAQHWKFAPIMLKGVGFVAIFFAIYFGFNLAGWLLHRSDKMLFLQTVNRAGGIAVGVGKGAAVAALAIFLSSSSSLLSQPTRESFERAYLVPPLSRLGESLIKAGKERIFPGVGAVRTPARERQAI